MASSSMRIGAFPDTEPITQTWTNQALWEAVRARKSEYTSTRKARIEIGTWNVASLKGTENDLGSWFAKNKNAAQVPAGSDSRKGEDPESTVNSLSAGSIVVEGAGGDRQERIQQAAAIQQRPGSVFTEDDIDIYVLGLQEIVDINSPTEALRPFVDPGPSQKWKKALKEALPDGYELIAEQQLVGLLILVAVAPSMTSLVSSVCTTSVGTGMLGYMGNKGAVAARLVLGELTRVVFINCHLAAGSEPASLERRNWDAGQITQKIKFDPVLDEAGTERAESKRIGDEDFAWWFGDLNYRLEGLSSDDVRRILMLHMRDEFDVPGPVGTGVRHESSKHTNPGHETASQHQSHIETGLENDSNTTPHPASLVTTLTSFLPHDQLRIQQLEKKAFHEGWREGLIAFLPTYKYDVGSAGTFDSSEKKRAPSWCDRILFRTHRDFLRYKEDVERYEDERKAREESKRSRTDLDKNENLIYDYDPETDGVLDEDEDEDYESKNSASTHKTDCALHLAAYTSYQHVSSSDHKPVAALFEISFEVADTELKRKLYAEVARQYDKLENEERPDLTLLVEEESNKEWAGSGGDSQITAGEDLIDFGKICYGQEKRRIITLANTGRVPARFALMQAVDGVDATLTWLTCSGESDSSTDDTEWHHSYNGVLLPGDSAAITFRLCVEDGDLIRALNQGQTSLEHVLILRVINGRDHFIPVEGVWMQSILGRSLEQLIGLPEGGVREAQAQSPRDGKKSGSRGSGSAPPALVELTTAIEYLVPRVILAWSMKEGDSGAKPPWETDMSWPFSDKSWTLRDGQSRKQLKGYVYEALDNNKSARSLFPTSISFLEQLEILGEVLTTFITTLEDGIVTEKLWATIEQEMVNREKNRNSQVNEEEEVARIFEILSTSPIHSVSFVFLTSMLSRISAEIVSSAAQDLTPAITCQIPPPHSPSATTTGLESSQITQKRRINREYAEVFSKMVIRCSMPSREKDKRAVNERRNQLIQLFLNVK